MSVRLDGDRIFLEGVCRVEDAEPLLSVLRSERDRIVDLTEAEHLHAAVLQVLMALRPKTVGAGKSPFMQDWVTPAFLAACTIDMAQQGG